ncbi:Peptidase family M23 [Arcanobacterium phocae]|uniref:Peptidase family M23 n=1 Tax=Arcanobacterium phocae TaxID=131112 RepID=A0A1H2L9E5_9ACTO|nr:M23 family metallopeptidase [Arcanobacterium phocae]SDU77623.1 Peptidase family M23 [Arcanobacterium phocae]
MSETRTRPSRRDLRLARQAQQAQVATLSNTVPDLDSVETKETVVLPLGEQNPCSEKTGDNFAQAELKNAHRRRFFCPISSLKTLAKSHGMVKTVASVGCAFALAVTGGIGLGSFVFGSSAIAHEDDGVLHGIEAEGSQTPSRLRAFMGAADSARYQAYEEQFSGKPIVCQTTASANSLTADLRDKVDKLIYPMAAGTYTRTSPFGYRVDPIYGSSALHSGVDFAGALGTPIYAVADGKVVYSGTSPRTLGAHVVAIQHEIDGTVFTSWYWHSFSAGVHVKEGDDVRLGQHIADVGNSGHSTGPHLHLEIHPGAFSGLEISSAVDPEPFLKEHGAVDINDICGTK